MSDNEINEENEQNENEDEENEYEENENDESDSKNPVITLAIDIGNGKVEQLKLFSLENTKKDIYDFCMNHKLDYDTMDDINNQVEDLIKEKLNELDNEEEEEEEEEKEKKNEKFKKEISEIKNKKVNKTHSLNRISSNIKKKETNLNLNNQNNSVSLFQYQLNDNLHKKHKIKNKSQFSTFNNITSNSNSIKKNNTNNNNSSKINNNNSKIKKNNSKINKYQKESSITTNFLKNFHTEQRPYIHNNNGQSKIEPSHILENDIIKTNDNKYYLSNKSPNNNKNKKNKVRRNIAKFLFKNDKKMIKPVFNYRNVYDKNLEYKEKGKKKLEKLRNNIKEDEDELLPFKPQINKISYEAFLKRKGNEFDNSKIIKNYKNYQEQKIKELFIKRLETDPNEKQYTFQPKINTNYKFKNKNDEKNSYLIERYEKLYEYNNLYKEKRNNLEKELENKYSFKPILNDNSEIKESFIERLQQYENQSKEHLNKIKQNIEDEINELRKPDLYNNIRAINIEKVNSKNDPYTNLYIYNDLYKENKKELEKKVYENYFSNPQINESSKNIFLYNKEKSFKKIFKLLDGDGDGIIKCTAINKDKLPNNILEILTPIFKEIKEDNESLNEKEFISVCNQLYKILPYEKRKIIAYFCKENKKVDFKRKHTPFYPFKPKINKNSERIYNSNNYSLRDTSNTSLSNRKVNYTWRNYKMDENTFFS